MMLLKRTFRFLSLVLPFLSLMGCGGGGGDSGQLKMSLIDAGTDQYNAVYITVDSIEVHSSGAADDSWETVVTPQKTVNLLDLMNGVREEFNIATLSTGHYTQVRLHLGKTPDSGINILSKSHPFANYVIDTTNTVHELKVPSGFQTGVKIVHEFDVNSNGTTELLLDFDASASVVIAGNSGQYLLKPTIKILETVNFTLLSGTVKDGTTGTPLEGVRISAQIFNAGAADEKDKIVIQAATVTESDGSYKLFIQPGTYNMVAYKQGDQPTVTVLALSAGTTPIQDFTLTTASGTGTVTGQDQIAGADSETFVTSSFRQDVTVNGVSFAIELVSINVANGGTYSVSLPVANYNAVSSTFGLPTQKTPVTVTSGGTTTLNVNF